MFHCGSCCHGSFIPFSCIQCPINAFQLGIYMEKLAEPKAPILTAEQLKIRKLGGNEASCVQNRKSHKKRVRRSKNAKKLICPQNQNTKTGEEKCLSPSWREAYLRKLNKNIDGEDYWFNQYIVKLMQQDSEEEEHSKQNKIHPFDSSPQPKHVKCDASLSPSLLEDLDNIYNDVAGPTESALNILHTELEQQRNSDIDKLFLTVEDILDEIYADRPCTFKSKGSNSSNERGSKSHLSSSSSDYLNNSSSNTRSTTSKDSFKKKTRRPRLSSYDQRWGQDFNKVHSSNNEGFRGEVTEKVLPAIQSFAMYSSPTPQKRTTKLDSGRRSYSLSYRME